MKVLYKVFFAILFLAACQESSGGNKLGIEDLYGEYELTGFEAFGGSLLSEEDANKLVGESVIIRKAVYEFKGVRVTNPTYRVEFEAIDKTEGAVVSKSLSVFYGYKDERDFVVHLSVFDRGKFKSVFEVIDSESLLQMTDGRFFFLKKKKL